MLPPFSCRSLFISMSHVARCTSLAQLSQKKHGCPAQRSSEHTTFLTICSRIFSASSISSRLSLPRWNRIWLKVLRRLCVWRFVELALDGPCSVARKSPEILGAPVLPIKLHEVTKAILQEHVLERMAKQSVDVFAPQLRRRDR